MANVKDWITVHPNGKENKGQPIPVMEGQSKDEAVKSFVESKTGKEYRQNTSYEEIKSKYKELENKFNDDLPSQPVEAFGFANKERLNTKDHVQHAKDMGFKNQKEYERAACEFWNTKRGKLYYSNRRKRYYRYEEKTNLLCVSSNGIIHTFMKKTKKEFEKTIKVDKLDG